MKRDEQKRIQKTLAKNHACYVLITCDEPTENGEMQVEMTYEGDAALASYLIQGAQTIMDEHENEKDSESTEPAEDKIDTLERPSKLR